MKPLPLLAAWFLLAAPLFGGLGGQLRSENGDPVAGARVTLSSGETTLTDELGRFSLRYNETADRLEVVHPGFLPLVVQLDVQRGAFLEIQLDRMVPIADSITVSAPAPRTRFAPASASTVSVSPAYESLPALTADLLATSPGVALNGQGGPFQVYSVRGVSRQRLLTSLAGAKLTSERRAGVSASFFDPFLIDAVDLIRGPSSTFHGSGALGGVADIRPRRFLGPEFLSTFATQGQEGLIAGGWGDENWSVGMAARRADDTGTADGSRLNTHFRQFSASVFRQWKLADRTLELTLIPALGRDLGKSNIDFPARSTTYPTEDHLVAHLALRHASGWRLEGFLHPQTVETRVEDFRRRTEVLNESFDFGFKGGHHWVVGASSTVHLGAEYFGRRGVTAREREYSLSGDLRNEARTLDSAREDELGLQAAISRYLGRIFLEGGLRLSGIRQGNGDAASSFGRTWSGFAGVVAPLGSQLQANLSAGTGVRFPALGERFFSGTTGRGSVVANDRLEEERSLNLEVGLKWKSERANATFQYFRNRVSDYIERVDLGPDLTGYTNLLRGTIQGVEWDTGIELAERLRAYVRGHVLEGTGRRGDPLADIPVNRLALGAVHQAGRLTWGSEWQLRGAKANPGAEERRIDACQPVTAYAGLRLEAGFRLTAALHNLLNQNYYEAADEKATPARGRSLILGLRWQRD